MKLRFRKRTTVFILIPLLMVALFARFVYFTKASNLVKLRSNLKAADETYQQADEKSNELPRLKINLFQREEDLKKLRGNLIQLDRVSDFLYQLNARASSAGIDSLDIKPMLVRRGELVDELPLHMELRASYGELVRYLHELERQPGAIRVDRIEIHQSGEVRGQLSIVMEGSFSVDKEPPIDPRQYPAGSDLASGTLVLPERDPFLAGAKPGAPRSAEVVERLEPASSLSLTAILYSDDGQPIAIINGKIRKQGEKVGGWEVVRIRAREVELRGSESELLILPLKP